MSAAPGPRTRLGALLLRKGLVTPVELETALEAQRTKGGLLGEILVRSGLASRPAIEDALAEQVGGRIEAEAGFGTGLRSQIASRRPRRAVPHVRAGAAAPINAVAVAPAPTPEPAPPPRPVLEAVPSEVEPSELEPSDAEPSDAEPSDAEPLDTVVRPFPREPRPVPQAHDLAAELMDQVTRWQLLADELRAERDAVHRQLTQRDRTLAGAYARIEEAAERLAAAERSQAEAEQRAAALAELESVLEERESVLEELRSSLEDERERRARVETVLAELRAELEARDGELREAREALEAAPDEPAPVLVGEHVVFVRTGARYELVSRDGAPPDVGMRLELGEPGRPYLVLKVGPSPFPGDERPCAFAEPA